MQDWSHEKTGNADGLYVADKVAGKVDCGYATKTVEYRSRGDAGR